MAKIKPIYLLGAAALAAYFFRDKLFGAGSGSGSEPVTEVDPGEAANPDKIIDTTKTGQTIQQAIETAKQVSQGVKDIKVLIKTKKGKKDISITKGAKKPKRKRRSRKKKAKIIIQPTQSSLKPFTSVSEQSSYAPGTTSPYFAQY
jgi:hypothetical protein